MAPSAADDKLNDEEKSILIDAVKAYPILWDPNHADSSKTKEKNRVWALIAGEMSELQTVEKDYEGKFDL